MATHSRGQNVKRVEVVWPAEFVDEIDKKRGQLSRSRFLRNATAYQLAPVAKSIDSPAARERLERAYGQQAKTPRPAPGEESFRNKYLTHPPVSKTARERLAQDSTGSKDVESTRQKLARRTELMRKGIKPPPEK